MCIQNENKSNLIRIYYLIKMINKFDANIFE